jgi:hypothetical protein
MGNGAFPKMKPICSAKITESAKGEICTLQISGICNHDPTTTVFCHFPDESHGMKRKSDVISGGYGCSACHDAIDGRTASSWIAVLEEKDWYLRRSQTRTWRRLIEKHIIWIVDYEC